jgi:hypothetical protein
MSKYSQDIIARKRALLSPNCPLLPRAESAAQASELVSTQG